MTRTNGALPHGAKRLPGIYRMGPIRMKGKGHPGGWPIRLGTCDGAQVASQRSPILRAGMAKDTDTKATPQENDLTVDESAATLW